jgi:hypothetical protein
LQVAPEEGQCSSQPFAANNTLFPLKKTSNLRDDTILLLPRYQGVESVGMLVGPTKTLIGLASLLNPAMLGYQHD